MVRGGLSILTASIFLAGEMAGSGVLALPYAILGTGNIHMSEKKVLGSNPGPGRAMIMRLKIILSATLEILSY